jgi:potassium channel
MLCNSVSEKVSEMHAEYFAPREDFVLQNEAPTDFYIVASGSVVKKTHSFPRPFQ